MISTFWRTIQLPPALMTLGAVCIASAAERDIPPAFGPYTHPAATDFAESMSFARDDRIVGTYFFYWYDVETKSHIVDGDGTDALTTHPPTLEDFSYKSARWFRKQLEDMEAAGIDVALMVFWGSPAEHATNTHLHWSFAGLPPLVQAREELLRAGQHPPRIGLFYDTSTLRHNDWNYHADLTTDYGRKFFYATVRDFYSCIPPKHWAMIEGKPIVLLYSPSFAKQWDQGVIDYTKSEFPKEFAGRVPWIAPQNAWNLKGDNTCAWGGALGYQNPGIGEIGPGYDHSAVPGRKPLVRDRENGKFYEQSWLKFLRRPSNFVMIETWNEFHEGTDITESKEYGRQYIKLTRKYSDLFKQGWKPPRERGPFTDVKSVSLTAGEPNTKAGLRLVRAEDGQTRLQEKEGRTAWFAEPFRGGCCAYIYFKVEDSFKWADQMQAEVTLDYFDAAPGQLSIEFDGSDTSAPFNGAYSSSTKIKLLGDRQWKTTTFELKAARWLGSQNAGADFRVVAAARTFAVSKVTLFRK